MTSPTRRQHPEARTRGTALVTALLVLVVLTLLGAAAVFTASTDLDIAGNGRRELHALSIAEAGVHEALARVNMQAAAAEQIVPQVDGSGNPVAAWSLTIVDKAAPGAGEVQTLTGVHGSGSALPVETTVQYKLEAVEQPVSHCDADGCNGEVVRFHEDFGYGGMNVPRGAQVGPPVLEVVSTFNDGAAKTIWVEAVRAISQANTPATLRACGAVTVTGSNTTDGSLHPDQVPVHASGTVTKQGGSTITPPANVKQNQGPCPADLFEQTFGMPEADMKAMAHVVGDGPMSAPASGTRGKIIWINGASATSTWNGNATIGTPAEPVIVVSEGNMTVNGNITIYGTLYVMGSLSMGNGNWKMYGAVVSGASTDISVSGNSTLEYDPTVMNNLNKLSPYTTITWGVE